MISGHMKRSIAAGMKGGEGSISSALCCSDHSWESQFRRGIDKRDMFRGELLGSSGHSK